MTPVEQELAAARYDRIAPLLTRYLRRFTLIDLGAGIAPYVSQRISREFDALVILVEQDQIPDEHLNCLGPRALWLRRHMTALDLVRLGCSEDFDVAIALNFLHHFDLDWRIAARAIETMATILFVQTPWPGDSGTCGREILPEMHAWLKSFTFMGESVQFPNHDPRPLFITARSSRTPLTMTHWASPENCAKINIQSATDAKFIQLAHKGEEPRCFIHGMNLWSFALLGGSWPKKDVVLKLIRKFKLPDDNHGDVTPHNFLFDGKELFLIDGHEGWEFDDRAGLKKTLEMMGDTLHG